MAGQPGVETANSRAIAKHHRYGGQLGTYRFYKRRIVANETKPTDPRQVTVGDRFSQFRFVAFDVSNNATGFDLHFGRVVNVRDPDGNDLLTHRFIEDPSSPKVATGTGTDIAAEGVIDIDGDGIWAYIANLAGVPTGDGIVILRKGVNKQSSK